MIFVRPPATMLLAYRNWAGSITGDLTKDFDLSDGYRLQGEFHLPDGALYTSNFWLEVKSI